MNVLVADDDGVIRLLLSSAMTKLGHSVHEATNGREAWDAWYGGEFSLVISDWMMPDLDGLEFCRRIRAERRAHYTYVVLLTSRSGKTNYLEAMTAGADDFMTKPFEKNALAARVRVAERILGLHASLRTANTDLERRVCERTAELETALHAKDEFLSRASHKLRTPMNHVLGFAQLLEMGALTDAQAASVQQILTSGQHLLQLIDRILAVSKSDSEDLSFLETSETESRSARETGNLMVFPSSSIPPPLEGRPPCRPRGCDSERLETGVEFLPKPCMAATLAHKVRELLDRPRLKPVYEQT